MKERKFSGLSNGTQKTLLLIQKNRMNRRKAEFQFHYRFLEDDV